ncbi:hypothetical protein BLNAU_3046 [Blattamonas nauphoetae]|uniref:Uncharacterized protein n=1 Tax=Blattamonas nauphoetae TaxID=2049346 RepID=A0ABQ9YDZ3_9EUKA|nr:hypothetical protein BLNAU_3046 [Blattamonas nauphoetae]
MISLDEDSPFLKWNPDESLTAASIAQIFMSLVSMVRDGYKLDEELVSKASKFLSSDMRTLAFTFDDFLKSLGRDSTDPAAALLCHSFPPISIGVRH